MNEKKAEEWLEWSAQLQWKVRRLAIAARRNGAGVCDDVGWTLGSNISNKASYSIIERRQPWSMHIPTGPDLFKESWREKKSTRCWRAMMQTLLQQNESCQASSSWKTMAGFVFTSIITNSLRSLCGRVTQRREWMNVKAVSDQPTHSRHWMSAVAIDRLSSTKRTRACRRSSRTKIYICILVSFFGLKNAPATFQGATNIILAPVEWRYALVTFKLLSYFSWDPINICTMSNPSFRWSRKPRWNWRWKIAYIFPTQMTFLDTSSHPDVC